MSKYKIRPEYNILNDDKYPPSQKGLYNLIRQLSKNISTHSISVAIYSQAPGVMAYIHIHKNKTKKEVILPAPNSTCPGTLLINMGTHTLDELWEEYYETWAAEIESQIRDVPVGDGP